jgi:ABC-type branched-subunit amino acid transport system ATPase component
MTGVETSGPAAADPAGQGTPALQVVELQKFYGAVKAVDGVSLTVADGAIVGLIGPNGSGKSTFIEVVSGLTSCDGGKVLLHGTDISRMAIHHRAKLGLRRTFQASRLWPRLTVAENLLAASPPAGRDKLWNTYFRPGSVREAEHRSAIEVGETLRSFGLSDLRDRPASVLSGGQGRLLEFARIMVSGATVALLDEPLAGVNPVMAESVITGVMELRRHGLSVLLVEHNLEAVEALCDTIYGMAEGRLAISGSMDEISRSTFFADAYLGTAGTAAQNG